MIDRDPHTAPDFHHSALVLIDIQNDFLEGGSSPIIGTSQIVPRIARLLAAYRSTGRPIVHLIRLYAGDDVDLPRRAAIARGAQIVRPGTHGSQITDALLPAGAPELDPALLLAGSPQPLGQREAVLWKPRWSAFHRTGLDGHLTPLELTTPVFAGCNYPTARERASTTPANATTGSCSSATPARDSNPTTSTKPSRSASCRCMPTMSLSRSSKTWVMRTAGGTCSTRLSTSSRLGLLPKPRAFSRSASALQTSPGVGLLSG